MAAGNRSQRKKSTGLREPRPASSGELSASFLAERIELLLIVLTLVYFLARLVFFAFQIDPSVPPDEMTHLGRSLAFGDSVWIPPDSQATYEFGLIRHRPPLFYLMMGKVLWLRFLPVSDLVLLRLANALIGLLTAIYGYRWFKLWIPVMEARVLALVMTTNVLMFTGVSASISYDTLTNLAAAMAVYSLTSFCLKGRARDLALSQLVIAAGCLTKVSFLPLAFALECALLVWGRKQLKRAVGDLLASFSERRWKLATVTAMASLMALWAVGLYGGNLLRYGRLTPRENQVLTLEQSMQYRIFARNYVVSEFRKGNLSYEEARSQAKEIPNPGNRNRALNLLAMAKDPERLLASVLEPSRYVTAWTNLMMADGLGYHGHRVIRKSPRELLFYKVILFLAVLIAWRKARLGEAGGVPFWGGAITAFYALVLMWLVNYRHYYRSGALDFALQGRYIFPVLVPICGMVAYFLTVHLPARSRWLVAVLAGGVFLAGDLPYFLSHVSQCWFMGASEIPRCAL
jgi:Dolichyl-phosphate-mannose-protein mannosyltransferase